MDGWKITASRFVQKWVLHPKRGESVQQMRQEIDLIVQKYDRAGRFLDAVQFSSHVTRRIPELSGIAQRQPKPRQREYGYANLTVAASDNGFRRLRIY